MQPGREHLVIGAPPPPVGIPDVNLNLTGTLTTGGHYFCARTIHSAMCVLLHLVMLQHLLTNADHIGLWEIFVRIVAFWLHLTRRGSVDQLKNMEAYCPVLIGQTAPGWIEIIYLCSIVQLLPAHDIRHYHGDPVTKEELSERNETQKMYQEWRQWFSQEYICTQDGVEFDMGKYVLEAVLLHLAIVLVDYHTPSDYSCPRRRGVPNFHLTLPPRTDQSIPGRIRQEARPEIRQGIEKVWFSEHQIFLFQGSNLEFSRRREMAE
ncbi:hypothetical protein B0H14DRAFT_3903267 [Mycena olivaceomarginata]|nr:hypothetical protein B0H14DRAFT_3903267 [Mycena olivaceomarginata]